MAQVSASAVLRRWASQSGSQGKRAKISPVKRAKSATGRSTSSPTAQGATESAHTTAPFISRMSKALGSTAASSLLRVRVGRGRATRPVAIGLAAQTRKNALGVGPHRRRYFS